MKVESTLWGVGNQNVFYLRARKFRLRDARTSVMHLELIIYKIDGPFFLHFFIEIDASSDLGPRWQNAHVSLP